MKQMMETEFISEMHVHLCQLPSMPVGEDSVVLKYGRHELDDLVDWTSIMFS